MKEHAGDRSVLFWSSLTFSISEKGNGVARKVVDYRDVPGSKTMTDKPPIKK